MRNHNIVRLYISVDKRERRMIRKRQKVRKAKKQKEKEKHNNKIMEDKRCFMPDCEEDAEWSCSCTSSESYFCQLHMSEHIRTSASSHCIERIYKDRKQFLLKHLQSLEVEQDLLRRTVRDSFTQHFLKLDASVNRFISEHQSYTTVINYCYEKISKTEKISEYEEDPILKLVNLSPKNAIESIDLICKTAESINYSKKVYKLLDSLHETFLEKLLEIKKSLIKPSSELDEESKSYDMIEEAKLYFYNLSEAERRNRAEDPPNLRKLVEIAKEGNTQEPLVQSKTDSINKISRMDQLFIENPIDDCLFCTETRGLRLEICKGIIRDTGEKVAIKCISSDKEKEVLKNMREVQIYESLSKKNSNFILKYYGHFNIRKQEIYEKTYNLCIVTELCEYTLLDEFLKLNSQKIYYQNHELAQKFHALLSLFKSLSEEKIVYCNIDPRYIFIVDDSNFKLGDFYLAKTTEIDEVPNPKAIVNFDSEPSYWAPEIMQAYKYQISYTGYLTLKRQLSTEKSDVFSLGLVFLMMMKFISIKDLNEYDRRDRLDQIIENLTLGWGKRLLKSMLANDREKRPSFEEALRMLEEDPEFNSCFGASN